MAASLRKADGPSTPLRPLLPSFRVGRSPDCHLVLAEPYVSGEHARLRHVGGGEWVVRDLGSKNGVFLNQRRIQSGDASLSEGDTLWFGDEREAWTFSAGEPCDLIAVVEGQAEWGSVAVGHSLLALPSAEVVEATLLRRGDGWLLEAPGDGVVPVSDGQLFSLEGRRYRVWISNATDSTKEFAFGRRCLADATLWLGVSRDEEQIEGELRIGAGRLCLPARVYLYLLVVLGRYQHEDTVLGVSSSETGWRYTDHVSRSLGVDLQGLNLQVHRARQDLAKLGFEDPAGLIERRPLSKQLRLGVRADRVVVTTL